MHAVATSLIAAPTDHAAEPRGKAHARGREGFAGALASSGSPARAHHSDDGHPDIGQAGDDPADVPSTQPEASSCDQRPPDDAATDPSLDPAIVELAAALMALAAPIVDQPAPPISGIPVTAPPLVRPTTGVVAPVPGIPDSSAAEVLDAIGAVLTDLAREFAEAQPVSRSPAPAQAPADAAAALLESAPPALVAVAATPAVADPTRREAVPVDAASSLEIAPGVPTPAANRFGGSARSGDQAPSQPQSEAEPAAPVAMPAPTTAEAVPARAETAASAPTAIVGERASAVPVVTTTNANAVERAVAQQVAKAVANHHGVEGKPLILRLTPPELGTVRIEISERAGQITARIHAEDAAVRTAIERFLPQLKQDLRANDAPIRDVVLADAYQQQGQQERDRSQESGERRQRATRGPGFALDGVAAADSVAPSARTLGGHVADDMVDARA